MASIDDHRLTDEPVRFRLRTLFLGIAVIAVALTLIRGCPCVSETRLYRVRKGMTESEVLAVMGRPPWREGWSHDRKVGHMTWIGMGLDPLFVEFEDGRVCSWDIHD